jgi:threonine dehydrogenase-like Zn-dependent dehydrogenase
VHGAEPITSTTDGYCTLPIQAAYGKNLTLRIGRGNARLHVDTLMPLVVSRQLRHRAIISHEVGLSEAPHAYDIFRERRDGAIKVLLVP